MAQMEDALNSILGNQQAMAQIMALANSISGEAGMAQESQSCIEEEQAIQPEFLPEPPSIPVPKEDRDLALLGAVKPFLRTERQEKLEQALELVRMLRMFRTAFGSERGGAPE